MKILKNIVALTFVSAVALLLSACSQEPHEVHYGSDECAYCKMMITDNRFAAQAITETGKSIKFDAIECMADYASENKQELQSAELWVSDFNNPGDWLNIDNAFLIKSEVINSPMGESLLALDTEKELKEHLAEYPGERVEWQRLVK